MVTAQIFNSKKNRKSRKKGEKCGKMRYINRVKREEII